MKRIILLIILLITVTGCNQKTVEVVDDVDHFAIIDDAFKINNINFTRDGKIDETSYYAKEAWQYLIDNTSCVVDIYYYDENTSTYKEAYQSQSILAKNYDNIRVSAVVNKGFGAIIWDGCNIYERVRNILENL